METDFDAFIAHDGVTSTLAELAEVLGISPGDIALLDIRYGCVILVISLPEDAANRLLTIGSTAQGDSLRELATSLAISKVTAGDEVSGAELLRLTKLDFDPDFSWLHLSDLHITSDYKDPTSDTYNDLNRFLEDLPKRLTEAGLTPDVTFFTGDVAQSGSEDEYEVAQQFLADFQQALPSSSRLAPIFIVPGNHDVSWAAIDIRHERKLRRLLKSSKDPARILEEHGEYIRTRQRNFCSFMEKLESTLAGPSNESFSFTRSFCASSNLRVGVAGFNSSWLSTRKDLYKGSKEIYAESLADLDLQHLRLGTKQLRAAAAAPDLRNSDIRIALMHHEPLSEWYAEADRPIQRQELSRYHFILRGHQHETRARVGAKIGGADDFVELAPGALRTRPHWYQGFMTAELDLNRGLMRLRAWSVTGHTHQWLPDAEFGYTGTEFRLLPNGLRRAQQ
jgi:predicted phosphodiesterase